MKTQVYSWRLSGELKSELERAARAWLAQNAAELGDDEEAQRKLHATAEPFIGCLEGDNPGRSKKVRELVREKLRRKYGR